MTLDELVTLVGNRPVARVGGVCFFTTYRVEVADEWAALGACLQRSTSGSQFVAEVHFACLLDPILEEDETGELVDRTRETLLAYYRERDRFALPLSERETAK